MIKPLDFFKDKQGRIVIAQTPNLPLIVWFIVTIMNLIWSDNHPRVHYVLNLLSFGFIFTWAWLEIAYGVNYFRRTLGLLVIIIAIGFK